MLRLTCFALLVTLGLGLELKVQLGDQWTKFKSSHGKQYSGVEEQKRKENFKKNVQAILEHNLKCDMGEVSYTQGVNEFSDMDHNEFVKKMCGTTVPASMNKTGTPMRVGNVKAPASLDWRQSNAVTSVKNQGACGSCWTFCTVGCVEGAWARKRNELIELSQQNLLDCSSNTKYGNGGCDGGVPDYAMQYIIDNGGLNAANCYPYTGKVGQCKYNRNCKNVQISKYYDVPEGNEKALLEAVANNGPVSVAFDAGQFDFQSYKGGVYDPPYCSQNVNHGVTLIGYGTEGGKDYWLIKNSWGSTWGDKGYFKLRRNKGNLCGITNMASYVVV